MNKSVKIIIKTDKAPEAIKQMVERKDLIKAFHRGEVTKAQLDAKGIRFIAPVQL
jgi:hypothetical protein